MYITNNPIVASIARDSGVDRIFLDMEFIGKTERQCGLDTVLNCHTIEDIIRVRDSVPDIELLVRSNKIYDNSENEINDIIHAGADVVMLPYFKTVEEVSTFVSIVARRAKVCLLVETPEAVELIDDVLNLDGIDEVHIGINDLSIGYGKKFLFEVLEDGTVDYLCKKCSMKNIPYGFGGIASLGRGLLPSEYVIMEHYRLGSRMAILSRSFCNTEKMHNYKAIEAVFVNGVRAIREYEKYCEENPEKWESNRIETASFIRKIAEGM